MMISGYHNQSWISGRRVEQLTEIGKRKRGSSFESEDNDLLMDRLILIICQDKSMKMSKQRLRRGQG